MIRGFRSICVAIALVLFLAGHAPAQTDADSAWENRVKLEERARDNPFFIAPHRPNYILPVSYNTRPNTTPFTPGTEDFDHTEMKFQFSMKLQVARDVFHNNGKIYFAYTNLSFWQAYNKDASSPFRETNHEPELFLTVDNDWNFLGLTNRANSIGVVHQSNGRSGALSRSWNRIYGLFMFDRGNFLFALKPWYRIPEEEKSSPTDPTGDDNPDINKFLGSGELYAFYKWDRQTFGLMLRNNLRRHDNKGAIQLDWSFPVSSNLKGYVQYFSGYGESLIDYNAAVHRISLGVLLTDWL
ncbi:MAG: phospholipase [Desulfuromonas sp.]|nr:MAG: phospholipase [Desulfuromonas sp.]